MFPLLLIFIEVINDKRKFQNKSYVSEKSV